MKAEHRGDKRSSVFLTATMRSADGDVEVKLTNLSSLGARADYPIVLAPGTPVQISRGDLTVDGSIAWAAEGKIGIEFAEPVNLREFRMQGQVSGASILAPLHKPVEKLSPRLERQWAKILGS